MQDASVGAGLLHVFGNGNDAVVGGQRDDIISVADLPIQLREEVAEILVQPHENVLDFAAARAEFVSDEVHGRVADGEEIGSVRIAQLQGVHGFLGEFRESRVGVRARGPLFVKSVVRFADAGLSTKRMGESETPTVGRDAAESFFPVPIGGFREGERPGLGEVGFRGVRLGLLLDEWLGAVGAGSDPGSAVEPGDRISFVSCHGDGGAGFQGKRHNARRSAGLKFQFLGKGGHGHTPGGVCAFGSSAGVADVFHVGIRVGGAGDHFLFFAVPPGVGDHAMGGGKCAG